MNFKRLTWKLKARRFNPAKAAGNASAFCRGFTLIELMIAIAIIGILAAIAIPNFVSYRQKGYDALAASDIKNSYDAARAYFIDFPDKTFSDVAQLDSYGFRNSDGVTSTISGNAITLMITARHSSGSKTFSIDASGKLGF